MLAQRTIRNKTSATGVGLHTGVKATLTLHPADPDTGIARHVILNADMANVTSRTLTIYKITPGNNAGVGLNDSTIAQSSTGALIKDLDMGIGTGGARIGNTGSNRLVTIIFESESDYQFGFLLDVRRERLIISCSGT